MSRPSNAIQPEVAAALLFQFIAQQDKWKDRGPLSKEFLVELVKSCHFNPGQVMSLMDPDVIEEVSNIFYKIYYLDNTQNNSKNNNESKNDKVKNIDGNELKKKLVSALETIVKNKKDKRGIGEAYKTLPDLLSKAICNQIERIFYKEHRNDGVSFNLQEQSLRDAIKLFRDQILADKIKDNTKSFIDELGFKEKVIKIMDIGNKKLVESIAKGLYDNKCFEFCYDLDFSQGLRFSVEENKELENIEYKILLALQEALNLASKETFNFYSADKLFKNSSLSGSAKDTKTSEDTVNLFIDAVIKQLIIDLKIKGVKEFYKKDYNEVDIMGIDIKIYDDKYNIIRKKLTSILNLDNSTSKNEEQKEGGKVDITDLDKVTGSKKALQIITDEIIKSEVVYIKKKSKFFGGSGTEIKVNKKKEINSQSLVAAINKASTEAQKDNKDQEPSTTTSKSHGVGLSQGNQGAGKG